MFDTLKRLYDGNKLNKNGLKKAVARGWITMEQYDLIVKGG